MKILKSTMVAISLLSLLIPGVLYAQGQVNLSNSRQFDELPFVIVRPNGEVLVAWCGGGHFNKGGAVFYRSWKQNSGWTPVRIVAPDTSAFPQMALDAEGDVHMSYWEGAGSVARDIYYQKYSNGSWGSRQLVYDSWGYNSAWNRCAVEGNRIYILWCHNYAKPTPQDAVLIEKSDGGSFPANYVNVSRATKSTSIHCWLTVKNGNVYAAWMDDNHQEFNWNIYYTERINGYWRNPQRVDPGPNQYVPALAVDNGGNVHLIYSRKAGPVYYMRKSPGGSWSAAKEISSAKTDVTTFQFMKLVNGMLHAVWRQREGDGQYIVYGSGTLSGQWGEPVKVSHAGAGEYPGLDVGSDGKVHVVYSDLGVGGERDVFYVRVDQITSYPVASFTATPSQGQPPLDVHFNASASYDPDGNIKRYEWDFGDGTTGLGVEKDHIYTKRGMLTAKLTVIDNDDQSSSLTTTIMVGNPPVASIKASPTAGAAPMKVVFDGSDSTDPDGYVVSYRWDFGDGGSATGPGAEHTYTANATYTARLTVKDNDGLEASDAIEIEVSTGPIARISASPKHGEAPLRVNFSASNSKPAKSGGTLVKFEWDFGDGSYGQGVKTSHTYSKTGAFNATLIVTDSKGQGDSATKTINVYAKPTARFTASSTFGIAPHKVTYDASSSNDPDGKLVNYGWTFGDGTSGSGKVVSHTFTKGGNFTVWLTVTDDDGWQDSTYKSVEIIEKPFPPKNFQVTNVAHTGLFFSTYLNILTWDKNPKNTGKIKVVKYLIFKKKKGTSQFIYQATMAPDIFTWEDLGLTNEADMKGYIYGIRSVDGSGRESDMKTRDSGQ